VVLLFSYGFGGEKVFDLAKKSGFLSAFSFLYSSIH